MGRYARRGIDELMGQVTLSKPVEAYGETVTVLTFRAPNGQDIAACGYPMRFEGQKDNDEVAVYPIASAIASYIARLANIPRGAVNQLSADDFTTCMGEVMGFFGQATPAPASRPTSSIDTSTQHGSGNSQSPIS
jgi:tail assembly chaperone E/41/14-like protein